MMMMLCLGLWLAVLLPRAVVEGAGVFEWTLQTLQAAWPARHAGGVECWPTRLSFNDMQDVERTVPAGGVDMTGCPLVLWGGENRRARTVLQDVWVSTNAGRRPESTAAAHLLPAARCPPLSLSHAPPVLAVTGAAGAISPTVCIPARRTLPTR